MCDFLIDIVPREEALKAATAAPFEQPEYTNYYAQGTTVPPYTAQQVYTYTCPKSAKKKKKKVKANDTIFRQWILLLHTILH